MKKIITLASILFAMSGAQVRAALPLDYSFTYQGLVTQDGAPASGIFDVRFRLFDAAVLGNQIGPELFIDDIVIEDGVFTSQLNFGDAAFAGAARWIEISIDGGNGQFAVLSPRQPITATPFAVCALNHIHWTQTGNALTNANAGSFVGVNTTSPITGREYFGVQSPVQSGYGGMYMATDGGTAKPFYGYSTGAASAWTYLDGQNGDWRIYNSGDRVTVTDQGRVGIGIGAPQAALQTQNAAGDASEALFVTEHGGGKAALLESHQQNAEPAVSIFKNNGPALEATGDVEIGGGLYTGPPNALLLGTPIAFGCFTAWAADPAIQSGTGNFTVTFDGSWGGFLIHVDDDSDPATWIVQAGVTYFSPAEYGEKIEIRTGIPNASGTFRVVASCYADCNIPCCAYGWERWNFVVYRP